MVFPDKPPRDKHSLLDAIVDKIRNEAERANSEAERANSEAELADRLAACLEMVHKHARNDILLPSWDAVEDALDEWAARRGRERRGR